MPPLLRLLRPHQYGKNLLIFSAPGAAGRLDEPRVFGLSLVAFALFCAVSSAGYVMNDLADIEADRQHPTKRNRPLANGSVSPQHARLTGIALVVGAFALSFTLDIAFVLLLVGYGALTATYSLALKQVPWVELFAVSAGFLLRAVAGGAATETPLSGWFLVVVSAGAFLIITGKRLGEMLTYDGSALTRKVLGGYSVGQLRVAAACAAGLAVGGYGLWAAAKASDLAAGSGGHLFLRITAVPFAIAIGRYLVLSWRGAGETPESLVVRDRIMLTSGAAWLVFYAIGIYQ